MAKFENLDVKVYGKKVEVLGITDNQHSHVTFYLRLPSDVIDSYIEDSFRINRIVRNPFPMTVNGATVNVYHISEPCGMYNDCCYVSAYVGPDCYMSIVQSCLDEMASYSDIDWVTDEDLEEPEIIFTPDEDNEEEVEKSKIYKLNVTLNGERVESIGVPNNLSFVNNFSLDLELNPEGIRRALNKYDSIVEVEEDKEYEMVFTPDGDWYLNSLYLKDILFDDDEIHLRRCIYHTLYHLGLDSCYYREALDATYSFIWQFAQSKALQYCEDNGLVIEDVPEIVFTPDGNWGIDCDEDDFDVVEDYE